MGLLLGTALACGPTVLLAPASGSAEAAAAGRGSAAAAPAAAHGGPTPLRAAATVLQRLPGDWLGPFPGPRASCGKGYSEFYIYRTRSYTSTWNSQFCGGSTAYGRYSVSGNLLTFHQQSDPGCPTCTQNVAIPVTYRFLTVNALRLCDYPAGSCYMYYRQ